ncbi:hypothetical protein HYV49_00090 [Candidatus Pacearchaeota archaeon]|nr:hypothetical protein [Candidatus Pacearchaeota archaeon]
MELDLNNIYEILEKMRRSSDEPADYGKISPLISKEELRKYHNFLMDKTQARLDDESSRLVEIRQIILDAFQKRYSPEVYKELEKLVTDEIDFYKLRISMERSTQQSAQS